MKKIKNYKAFLAYKNSLKVKAAEYEQKIQDDLKAVKDEASPATLAYTLFTGSSGTGFFSWLSGKLSEQIKNSTKSAGKFKQVLYTLSGIFIPVLITYLSSMWKRKA